MPRHGEVFRETERNSKLLTSRTICDAMTKFGSTKSSKWSPRSSRKDHARKEAEFRIRNGSWLHFPIIALRDHNLSRKLRTPESISRTQKMTVGAKANEASVCATVQRRRHGELCHVVQKQGREQRTHLCIAANRSWVMTRSKGSSTNK